MPRVLKQLQDEPDLAAKYAAAFGEEPYLKMVNFNFIVAHSEGLFKKEDATQKDIEKNVEACFAVMVTTPWCRLSEEVLAKGISLYYQEQKLLPLGVHIEALESFAAQMALGLRKIVQRFRRMFQEPPHGAKSRKLAQLKARLVAAGVKPEDHTNRATRSSSSGSLPRPASAEDLAVLSPNHTPASVDWAKLGEKLKAFQAAKAAAERKAVEIQPVEPDPKAAEPAGLEAASGSKPATQARGLPTPARSTALPPFVLEALKAQVPAVQPFSTLPENDKDEQGECEAPVEKKQGKAKASAKKAKARAKKTKKGEIAGAEVESALSLEVEPAAAAATTTYVAGDFMAQKKRFIDDLRKKDQISFQEAQKRWMHSDLRANLLENMPYSELKRRRFA
ncbi:unnamed protein product [Durusdinium trenchii]|uniref:Uncharacterized protein n=2 Tax=Durusdinium trenchii TaxID=1381693 RepID=A0ABP0JJS0_9DINO